MAWSAFLYRRTCQLERLNERNSKQLEIRKKNCKKYILRIELNYPFNFVARQESQQVHDVGRYGVIEKHFGPEDVEVVATDAGRIPQHLGGRVAVH